VFIVRKNYGGLATYQKTPREGLDKVIYLIFPFSLYLNAVLSQGDDAGSQLLVIQRKGLAQLLHRLPGLLLLPGVPREG
jgi:hypothetical protein